jgi:hypothetical protein
MNEAERLLAWAHSDDGARAMWHAWLMAMQREHRDVARHQQRWTSLEPAAQYFHGLMAQQFVDNAIEAMGEQAQEEEAASGG